MYNLNNHLIVDAVQQNQKMSIAVRECAQNVSTTNSKLQILEKQIQQLQEQLKNVDIPQLQEQINTLKQDVNSTISTTMDSMQLQLQDVSSSVEKIQTNSIEKSEELIAAINNLSNISVDNETQDSESSERDIQQQTQIADLTYKPVELLADDSIMNFSLACINNKIVIGSVKTKDDEILPVLQSPHGGIAIGKDDGKNVWTFDTSKDDVLDVHVNDDSITPISIHSDRIGISGLQFPESPLINNITTNISKSSISNNTIPTTRAITKYIDKYIKSAIGSSLKNSININTVNGRDTNTDNRDIMLPDCDIYTKTYNDISTDAIFIDGVNALAFNDDGKDIVIKPSTEKGLSVGGFQLKNDNGVLCKLIETAGTEDEITGRIVYSTGEYELVDDIYVPLVTLSSMNIGVGVIDKQLHDQYVHQNQIHSLSDGRYVTVITSGIAKIKTNKSEPGKELVTKNDKGKDNFRAKVISKINDSEVICLIK